jgi:Uri superfamily endonuclease
MDILEDSWMNSHVVERLLDSNQAGILLPAAAGTYVLWLSLHQVTRVMVGKPGVFELARGQYAYVGSAHGAGGLRARVTHHLRIHERPHWHIDALRPFAAIEAVLYAVTPQRLECAWAQTLAALPGASVPIPHFGASDCRAGCAAHLVRLPDGIAVNAVRRALGSVAREKR